ncbi:hypothetical protein B9Z55_003713 [Caenorhabditis nigoni]|uniref:Uncharacterized protein n=1 Tax=Caenorhabditis nigoni TaxID=1611254 RepID=A0A2G5VRL7_9PELO|nr:hypothetical protein B9Z55_003713 [Caenorhabditis nigoni]
MSRCEKWVHDALKKASEVFEKCLAGQNSCKELIDHNIQECTKGTSYINFDCEKTFAVTGRMYCMTGQIQEKDIPYCTSAKMGFTVKTSTTTPTTTTPLPTTTTTPTTVPPTSTVSDHTSKILIGGLIVLVVFQFAALIVCLMCRRKKSDSQDLEDGGFKKKGKRKAGTTGGTRTGTGSGTGTGTGGTITEKKTKKKKNKKGKNDKKKKTNTKGTTGTTGNITVPDLPSSTPKMNGLAPLGCLGGIQSSINFLGKCDKWLFEALTNYCKTDKSLEPCQILRTTKAPFINLFRWTWPSTQTPTTPTTTTTIEPTTESLASNFMILGVLGLIGILILICLVVILLGITNKKAGAKKMGKKNKAPKTVSKTSSIKSKSTSGKSKKEEPGKMIP